MRVVELTFINDFQDFEEPITDIIHCSSKSIASVMQWYGSHYSGDPYKVYINGSEIEKDLNGEYVHALIEHTNTTDTGE